MLLIVFTKMSKAGKFYIASTHPWTLEWLYKVKGINEIPAPETTPIIKSYLNPNRLNKTSKIKG